MGAAPWTPSECAVLLRAQAVTGHDGGVGDATTAARAALLGTAALVALAGCSSGDATQAATPGGRVWFCQGVDADHAEGSRVEIRFLRGLEVLGAGSVPVTGAFSQRVAPGRVVVEVDGTQAVTITVGETGTAGFSAGTGCPPFD